MRCQTWRRRGKPWSGTPQSRARAAPPAASSATARRRRQRGAGLCQGLGLRLDGDLPRAQGSWTGRKRRRRKAELCPGVGLVLQQQMQGLRGMCKVPRGGEESFLCGLLWTTQGSSGDAELDPILTLQTSVPPARARTERSYGSRAAWRSMFVCWVVVLR